MDAQAYLSLRSANMSFSKLLVSWSCSTVIAYHVSFNIYIFIAIACDETRILVAFHFSIKTFTIHVIYIFCLLFGPPEFNCRFSFALVLQWCCSTSKGSPGVGRNTLFLSSPHLCFIVVFIRDLIVSRDDPLMS